MWAWIRKTFQRRPDSELSPRELCWRRGHDWIDTEDHDNRGYPIPVCQRCGARGSYFAGY